ncbi:MAG TPA: ACT domain-containing protein, partial [Defluviitaleaceae bacterium]|nr:ACT domain-containing protein [Defluviitaleaceae bacterium]
LGAKVLHHRSVEIAKKYNVELVVRSSLNNSEGTIVREVCNVEKMLVSGVAGDKNVARISVMGIPDTPGKAFDLFSLLAKNKISVDIILQSIGRDGTKDISFTLARTDLNDAINVIKENLDRLGAKDVVYKEDVAKVSIVGAGMATNPGIAAMMFEAMYNAGINISMISTSEVKISVLIDEKHTEEAMNAIHDRFRLAMER